MKRFPTKTVLALVLVLLYGLLGYGLLNNGLFPKSKQTVLHSPQDCLLQEFDDNELGLWGCIVENAQGRFLILGNHYIPHKEGVLVLCERKAFLEHPVRNILPDGPLVARYVSTDQPEGKLNAVWTIDGQTIYSQE